MLVRHARRRPFAASAMASEQAELVAKRVQSLQAVYEMTLPANQPYVMRLDGVAFRNYTDGMVKPFDAHFTRAMLLTTRDLMERCAARTAYCQSDEISLLFAPEASPQQILYGGRVQKMVSVLAALAAARFNWHISRMKWPHEVYGTTLRERIHTGSALFDARIFSAPDDIMAGEALYWRHAYDGRRNSVNMVGCQFYGSRQMHGMGLGELLERLRHDHDIDPYKKYPSSAVLGVLLKRRHFPHVGFNPKTGQAVPSIRARVEGRTFDWSHMDELARTNMLMAKLWEVEHPATLELIDLGSQEGDASLEPEMPKKPEMAEVPRYITKEGREKKMKTGAERGREAYENGRKLPPTVARELRELCMMLHLQ